MKTQHKISTAPTYERSLEFLCRCSFRVKNTGNALGAALSELYPEKLMQFLILCKVFWLKIPKRTILIPNTTFQIPNTLQCGLSLFCRETVCVVNLLAFWRTFSRPQHALFVFQSQFIKLYISPQPQDLYQSKGKRSACNWFFCR